MAKISYHGIKNVKKMVTRYFKFFNNMYYFVYVNHPFRMICYKFVVANVS
jgi:uncharacterized membrane-anchored protein YitT (DUF2179 family)